MSIVFPIEAILLPLSSSLQWCLALRSGPVHLQTEEHKTLNRLSRAGEDEGGGLTVSWKSSRVNEG